MLFVILGAGASYDCANQSRHPANLVKRPPRANELFVGQAADEVVSHLRWSQAAVADLRIRVGRGENVETVLEEWQKESSGSDLMRRQLNAVRFFLKDRLLTCSGFPDQASIAGMTNYVDLVNRLDKWRARTDETIAYVTFNYDLILDRALEATLFLNLSSLDGYVSDPSTKLFKVHGSVNWWHQTDVELPATYTAEARRALVIRDATAGNTTTDVVQSDNEEGLRRAHLPALSIPVLAKGQFECPSPHMLALRELLPAVTRILSIGWRAQEEHFLGEMASAKMKQVQLIEVVTQQEDTANAVIGRLMKAVGNDTVLHRAQWPGFSEFVDAEDWSVTR